MCAGNGLLVKAGGLVWRARSAPTSDGATRAGASRLARNGRDLGPYGLTANTVVPGAIDTERDWSQYPGTDREAIRNAIPVRRMGHVDDIAYACVYLCTTGSFVNGEAIHLNGGQYMF
jgi:NAD(P)-dependent dehydrogenase (short-subunit alcohol dehydrogenase family)